LQLHPIFTKINQTTNKSGNIKLLTDIQNGVLANVKTALDELTTPDYIKTLFMHGFENGKTLLHTAFSSKKDTNNEMKKYLLKKVGNNLKEVLTVTNNAKKAPLETILSGENGDFAKLEAIINSCQDDEQKKAILEYQSQFNKKTFLHAAATKKKIEADFFKKVFAKAEELKILEEVLTAKDNKNDTAAHKAIATKKENVKNAFFKELLALKNDQLVSIFKAQGENNKSLFLTALLDNDTALIGQLFDKLKAFSSEEIKEGKVDNKSVIDDPLSILKDLAEQNNKCGKFHYSYNILKGEIFYDQNQKELWEMLKSVSDDYLKAHIKVIDNLRFYAEQSLKNCKPGSSLGYLYAFEGLLDKPYIKNNEEFQKTLQSIDYKKPGVDIKKLAKEMAKLTHPDKAKHSNLEGYQEKDFNTVRAYIEDIHNKGGDIEEEQYNWFWKLFGYTSKTEDPNKVIGEQNREAECVSAKKYATDIIAHISKSTDKMHAETLDEKIHYHSDIAEFILKSKIFNNIDGFNRTKEYEKHMLKAVDLGGDKKIKYNLAFYYTKLQTKEGLDKALGELNKFTKLELKESVCSNFLKESINYLTIEQKEQNNIDLGNPSLTIYCKEEASYFAKVYNGLVEIENLAIKLDYNLSCSYYRNALSDYKHCMNEDVSLFSQLPYYQKIVCDICHNIMTYDL